MCNIKFVPKLAFVYRNCPLSLETTKRFQAYINMNGAKLVVNASSLLLATARARCVFVHVAVRVRLPSPRALRRSAYINQCDGRSAGWSLAGGVWSLGNSVVWRILRQNRCTRLSQEPRSWRSSAAELISVHFGHKFEKNLHFWLLNGV